MEQEFNDDANISKEQEAVDSNTTEDESVYEEVIEEDIEDIKSRLAKATELANNYKIRAEKAEKASKEKSESSQSTSKQDGELSSKDLYALMEAKVASDDIDDVREYASLKKISISEALKSSVMKGILSEKSENRKVASASNVGNSKRTTGKATDETLLENFKKGVLPETDDDIARLVKLRKG